MIPPLDFIHQLTWDSLPEPVRAQSKLCLLDLLGIAAGGLGTDMSRITRDHAAEDMPGTAPMLFDGRTAALPAAAMASAYTIDSLDGHDGYNPAKGHVGSVILAPTLLFARTSGASGRAFLEALVLGYELGSRMAVAQHGTAPDYHTSGSWGAVAAAATGARLLKLKAQPTRHALGIAEYNGPRSQMMRCIDYPTMLKDGAGPGAWAGASAVLMAKRGFTGSPALIVEKAPDHWRDLGSDWRILQQYFKPYPVCRWAQAPVEGVLSLRRAYDLTADDIDHIRVTTFHEAIRLATAEPQTTEEAQYSTSFPCAVAMVRGAVTPGDVDGEALQDPEILRLSKSLVMEEADHANANFPEKRLAQVTLCLRDGRTLAGDWMTPKWDATDPPSPAELHAKFHGLADPVLGVARATAIADAVQALDDTPLEALTRHLFAAP